MQQVKKGYEFKDVMLIPVSSDIASRDTPDISTQVGKLKLKIPIIAAPMRGIVGVELIKELGRLGGLGVLHRFWGSADTFCKALDTLKASGVPFGVSTGLNDTNTHILETGAKLLIVDVANGYLNKVLHKVEFYRKLIDSQSLDTVLVAGNVVTYQGVKCLQNAGADAVRVGIGSGQLCRTRDATGVGYPQFSAFQDIIGGYSFLSTNLYYSVPYVKKVEESPALICDGGIRLSGDMAKALAAGADAVMIGSLLATTYEADTAETIYGMASVKLATDIGKEIKSIEGMEFSSPKKTRSLENLVDEFSYGLKSCMTYLNAKTLPELRRNATWITTGGE